MQQIQIREDFTQSGGGKLDEEIGAFGFIHIFIKVHPCHVKIFAVDDEQFTGIQLIGSRINNC